MKKTLSKWMYGIFVMNVFVPIGTIFSACLGCDFILINYSVFAVITAVTSVYTVIFSFVCRKSVQDKWIQMIFAILPFLSLINAVFYFFKGNGSWIVISVWIFFICCIILAIKYGKPLALKVVLLVLCAFLILPLVFISVIIFFSIPNTVMQSVESPNGKYYAEVIASDQGALGGDTLVNVCRKKGIDVSEMAGVDFAAFKETQYDILAAELRKHLDMEKIYQILDEGI